MGDNQNNGRYKLIDTCLFVVMMLSLLCSIEFPDSVAFYPAIFLAVAGAVYFAVKGVLRLSHTEPIRENEDDIVNMNFMHRSKAVATLIAAVVKAQDATSGDDLAAYSKKVNACNERINNLWIDFLSKDEIDLQRACNWLERELDEGERYVSAEYMYDIAHLTANITDKAWICLLDIAKQLRLSKEDIEYLQQKYAVFYNQQPDGSEKAKACRILGVKVTANEDEAQVAFYKLVKRYQAEGITDDNLKKYTEVKLHEINSALISLTENEKTDD